VGLEVQSFRFRGSAPQLPSGARNPPNIDLSSFHPNIFDPKCVLDEILIKAILGTLISIQDKNDEILSD
jgi:hypothetical protein